MLAACSACPISVLDRYPAVMPDPGQEAIYLLHFSRPFGHARHYLGWTTDLRTRLRDHYHGNGASAKLLKAAHAAGVRYRCVRWWAAGYGTEQAMKHHRTGRSPKSRKGRNGARTSLRPLCPICHPTAGQTGRTIAGQQVTTGWIERTRP